MKAGDTLNRDSLVDKLRPSVLSLLDDVEREIHLSFQFELLPRADFVATYAFDALSNVATIRLRADWEDTDLAASLVQARLELVEGYSQLEYRLGGTRASSIQPAVDRLRSYVDSQAVQLRMAGLGFRVDGEVIKRQFFDGICTYIPFRLREGRARSEDGMAHLDASGFGDLRRAAFLLQAELALADYGDVLVDVRKNQLFDFIDAFRTHRPREAQRADAILALFRGHDVRTAAGHREILCGWAALEELDRYVVVSRYVRHDGRYVLILGAH